MSTENGMTFDVGILKGHALQRKFVDRHGVRPSPYQHLEWLDHYGWGVQWPSDGSDDGTPLPQDTPKWTMYHDLGLSTRSDRNVKITVRHIDSLTCLINPEAVSEDQRVYRPYHATGALYSCVYDPHAILVTSSESPAWCGSQRGILGDGVVPLKRWSDVVFLQWQDLCTRVWRTHMADIRAIVQLDITNQTTIRIVNEALRRTGMPLNDWPHKDWTRYPAQGMANFSWSTAEYQAILATPNGVGPAHLLLGHPDQLGKKMISAISVFRRTRFGTDTAPMNLCFHIKDCK